MLGTTSFGKGTVRGHLSAAQSRRGAQADDGRLLHRERPVAEQAAQKDLAALLEEEDGDGKSAADSAAADDAKPEEFRTSMGRVVYGGGGVTPDLEVKPDSAAPVVHDRGARDRAAFA